MYLIQGRESVRMLKQHPTLMAMFYSLDIEFYNVLDPHHIRTYVWDTGYKFFSSRVPCYLTGFARRP